MSQKRFTYEDLKKFTSKSGLFQAAKFTVQAFNGCYFIYDKHGERVVSGETPKQCWENYCVFLNGYMFALREDK